MLVYTMHEAREIFVRHLKQMPWNYHSKYNHYQRNVLRMVRINISCNSSSDLPPM